MKKRTKSGFFKKNFCKKKTVQILAICEILVYHSTEREKTFGGNYGIYLKRTTFGYVPKNAANP